MRFMFIAIVWVFAALAFPEYAAIADDLPGADMNAVGIGRFFEGAEVRLPGSPGNIETDRRVAERFRQSGFEHGEIRFAAALPQCGQASLTTADGTAVQLLAMHPSLFRPGNFLERRFSCPLVYAGTGQRFSF